jgi:group I intron endonuclease
MQGIYQIKNKNNNKIYIGSSSNITYRWNQHVYNLIFNIHPNYKLQSDFNRYEINNFEFSILELVENEKELLNVEQKYIDALEDIENNYNILSYSKYEYVDRIKDDYNIVDFSLSKKDIKNLIKNINICQHEKLNSIGEDKFSLSKGWYNKASEKDYKIIKNNISNFYTNITEDHIYWTCFMSYQRKVANKGYIKSFVGLQDIPKIKRNDLAFVMNIFSNPFIKRELGIYDNDYAIKILLHWILNVSDINKQINLYIPSLRMRNLLIDWIDSFNI